MNGFRISFLQAVGLRYFESITGHPGSVRHFEPNLSSTHQNHSSFVPSLHYCRLQSIVVNGGVSYQAAVIPLQDVDFSVKPLCY